LYGFLVLIVHGFLPLKKIQGITSKISGQIEGKVNIKE